jgi:hypothetical protein
MIADEDDTTVGACERRHTVVASGYAKTIAHSPALPRDDLVLETLRQIEHASGIFNQVGRIRDAPAAGYAAMKHGWSSCSSNNALQKTATVDHKQDSLAIIVDTI